MLNDIWLSTDSGQISALLDLNAAFDTVDCRILLDRLENWVGLSKAVLNWFGAYLEEWSYCVTTGSYESDRVGSPQESVTHQSLI